MSENQDLIEDLNQNDIIDLLQLGPKYLENFLKFCVKDLLSEPCQKKDDDKQTYLLENGHQSKNYNEFKNSLVNIDAQNDQKMPAKMKMTLIELDLRQSGTCSFELLKAIEECQIQEIYKTEFIKNIIQYKWRQISWQLKISLFLQFLQVCVIIINTYLQCFSLNILLLISVIYNFTKEGRIYYVLGLNQKINKNDRCEERFRKKIRFNSIFDIILILLLFIYSGFTLRGYNQSKVGKLLPFINILSWFKFMRELEIFKLVRKFNLAFTQSMQEASGFMLFFLFMFVSFSTTRVIIEKNKLSEELSEGLNLTHKLFNLTHEASARDLSYTEEFGKIMSNLTHEIFNQTHNPSARDLSNTEEFGKLMFSVWGSMIRGDFDNDANEYPGFYIRFCGVCIVFMANVILLNLLVAVLGDAYDQVKSNQNELLLNREKNLIIRQEAFFQIFYKPQISQEKNNLFWIDYVTQNSQESNSRILGITERIKQSFEFTLSRRDYQFQKKMITLDSLKQEMSTQQEQLKKEILTQQKQLKKEISTQQNQLKNELVSLKKEISAQKDQLSEILEIIKRTKN